MPPGWTEAAPLRRDCISAAKLRVEACRITGSALSARRDQRQRDRVDAVALVGRRGVALSGEYVAQVAVAVCAQHLGARRAERMIGTQDHRIGVCRVEKRRPAAVGLEFLCAAEQFGAAGPALIDAFGFGVGVLTGEG